MSGKTSKAERIMLGYPGVILAAIVFPFAAGLVMLPFSLASGIFGPIAVIFGSFVVALYGMAVTLPVGLFCYSVVISFDCCFGKCIRPRTATMVAGGMTGFVSAGGLFVIESSPWLLCFAIPAVLFGQFGALRMYNQALAFGPHPPESANDWQQFGIRQIMMATLWFAAAFAILRLIPNGIQIVGPALLIWLPIHFVTLYTGYGVIALRKRWKQRDHRDKT